MERFDCRNKCEVCGFVIQHQSKLYRLFSEGGAYFWQKATKKLGKN